LSSLRERLFLSSPGFACMVKWQVLEGDCVAVLKTLASNSIDAVITSAPYFFSPDTLVSFW
jgi:predicted methyltransferase